MSKKLYSAFLLFCMIMLLGACGQKTEDKSEKKEIESEKVSTEEKKDTEKTETVDTEKMLSSLVYLTAREDGEKVSGAGFIMEITKEKVYICTSCHVIENHEEWQITFKDGTKLTGQKVGVSDVYDVGVVEVDVKQMPKDYKKTYYPVNIDVEKWKTMRDNAERCPIQVYKMSEEGLTEESESGVVVNFFADFRWGNKLNHTEMDINLQQGDSGSAIFDMDGYLISMAYGTSREDGKPKRWGVPLASIVTCYQEITGREYADKLSYDEIEDSSK